MTKDEYGDFVLRYKGCGACFPMYHTLSRFEKMWFTAIQKDVAELEKENAELKKNNKSYEKIIDNSSATLMKEKLKNYKQLTKAKEIIKGLLELGSIGDGDYTYVAQAEQFLKEVSE